MNNLKNYNWDINKGDFIHYELSLVRLEKKERLVRSFFTASLVAISFIVMLTLLHLTAKV